MDQARVGSTCRRLRHSGLSLSAPVLFFLSDEASHPPFLYHILVLMATRQSSRHSRPTNQSVSSNASASSSRSERASSRPQQNVSTSSFPSMSTPATRDCPRVCTSSIPINHLPLGGISISSLGVRSARTACRMHIPKSTCSVATFCDTVYTTSSPAGGSADASAVAMLSSCAPTSSVPRHLALDVFPFAFHGSFTAWHGLFYQHIL